MFNFYKWTSIKGDIIITCNVCGYLNSPTAVFCENCGSELSDSPDLDVFDDDDEWWNQ